MLGQGHCYVRKYMVWTKGNGLRELSQKGAEESGGIMPFTVFKVTKYLKLEVHYFSTLGSH